MLDRLPLARTDSLMELGRLMQADVRADKIDLGVGTYRDEHGAIPIMRVVKAAEELVLRSQDSKGYLGPSGDGEFALLLQQASLPALAADADGRIARIQTPGGTGALRLALQIIAEANPDARVWIATPTWPAHLPLVGACGLRVETYDHLDAAGGFNAAALDDVLRRAAPGDVLLLHGCCHNPTGVDLPLDAWRQVAARAAEAGLLPLVDLAYPGLGDGIEADVQGVRLLLAACPNALVALSCSKSFGLYRDRAGMLLGLAATRQAAANFAGVAASLARLLWSNPPDHGAAVVRTVLASSELALAWRLELDEMRQRVHGLRAALAGLPLRRIDLTGLQRQRGMFALLPLTPDDVRALREEHAVYMDVSGRINVAGLNPRNVERFAEALSGLDRG
ncbi:MAG: aspartate/tyrosine/aromatic aminotransferase [Phenylobacterium sp.]|nr:aspartate/tyrosine/aromatic aminotransferase [Phenylobacterium sp.]